MKYYKQIFTYMPDFSLSFFGPSLVLVWIQCILYARYIWVDSGSTTIEINFARCVCIVLLGIVAFLKPFSYRFQIILSLISVLLMTLGSLLFFVESSVPSLPFTLFAAICSGVGLAWGGGMWINVYSQFEFREALLATFGSLAISALIGIFIGYVEEKIAFFISMLLPVTVLVMYIHAQKTLNFQKTCGFRANMSDDVYVCEPQSTWICLAIGIALFSFVLGASRGFPSGESLKLSPLFQLVQHIGVAAASIGIIWWTLVKKGCLKFSILWQIQLAALAIGVIMLSIFDPLTCQIGATLIAVTNLFQVGFLWFVSYDIAQHRALPPYLILGFLWFLHLFFRETGRLVMLNIGGYGELEEMLIIAGMICALTVSVGFLLVNTIPQIRPLFADTYANIERVAYSTKCSTSLCSSDTKSPASCSFDCMVRINDKYSLTNRESEILAFLAEGRSASYIAKELVLSEHTVRSYIKSIYQKLDIHSKQDLIDYMKIQVPSGSFGWSLINQIRTYNMKAR